MKTDEDLTYNIFIFGFPSSSVVKKLPAMQETQEMQVWSLGWEDPLEEGMATHSSILAWRITWTEEPRGLQSMGSQSQTGLKWPTMHAHICLYTDTVTSFFFFFTFFFKF